MWVNINAKAKTIVLPHKNRGGNTSQILSCTHIHNYCRKHRKFAKLVILHNRTQNSEKFSPIITQNWHFLKCYSNCSTNMCKLLIHKSIKAAIDCSYIYCEERHGKVLQTCLFLFKCTIVFTGVKKSIGIITQNIKQINSTKNTNYSKNIS